MKNNKKHLLPIFAAFAVMAMVQSSHAAALFTLPTSFEADVTATIVGVAGTLLILLGLMFAWRKTVKSVNRS